MLESLTSGRLVVSEAKSIIYPGLAITLIYISLAYHHLSIVGRYQEQRKLSQQNIHRLSILLAELLKFLQIIYIV